MSRSPTGPRYLGLTFAALWCLISSQSILGSTPLRVEHLPETAVVEPLSPEAIGAISVSSVPSILANIQPDSVPTLLISSAAVLASPLVSSHSTALQGAAYLRRTSPGVLARPTGVRGLGRWIARGLALGVGWWWINRQASYLTLQRAPLSGSVLSRQQLVGSHQTSFLRLASARRSFAPLPAPRAPLIYWQGDLSEEDFDEYITEHLSSHHEASRHILQRLFFEHQRLTSLTLTKSLLTAKDRLPSLSRLDPQVWDLVSYHRFLTERLESSLELHILWGMIFGWGEESRVQLAKYYGDNMSTLRSRVRDIGRKLASYDESLRYAHLAGDSGSDQKSTSVPHFASLLDEWRYRATTVPSRELSLMIASMGLVSPSSPLYREQGHLGVLQLDEFLAQLNSTRLKYLFLADLLSARDQIPSQWVIKDEEELRRSQELLSQTFRSYLEQRISLSWPEQHQIGDYSLAKHSQNLAHQFDGLSSKKIRELINRNFLPLSPREPGVDASEAGAGAGEWNQISYRIKVSFPRFVAAIKKYVALMVSSPQRRITMLNELMDTGHSLLSFHLHHSGTFPATTVAYSSDTPSEPQWRTHLIHHLVRVSVLEKVSSPPLTSLSPPSLLLHNRPTASSLLPNSSDDRPNELIGSVLINAPQRESSHSSGKPTDHSQATSSVFNELSEAYQRLSFDEVTTRLTSSRYLLKSLRSPVSKLSELNSDELEKILSFDHETLSDDELMFLRHVFYALMLELNEQTMSEVRAGYPDISLSRAYQMIRGLSQQLLSAAHLYSDRQPSPLNATSPGGSLASQDTPDDSSRVSFVSPSRRSPTAVKARGKSMVRGTYVDVMTSMTGPQLARRLTLSLSELFDSGGRYSGNYFIVDDFSILEELAGSFSSTLHRYIFASLYLRIMVFDPQYAYTLIDGPAQSTHDQYVWLSLAIIEVDRQIKQSLFYREKARDELSPEDYLRLSMELMTPREWLEKLNLVADFSFAYSPQRELALFGILSKYRRRTPLNSYLLASAMGGIEEVSVPELAEKFHLSERAVRLSVSHMSKELRARLGGPNDSLIIRPLRLALPRTLRWASFGVEVKLLQQDLPSHTQKVAREGSGGSGQRFGGKDVRLGREAEEAQRLEILELSELRRRGHHLTPAEMMSHLNRAGYVTNKAHGGGSFGPEHQAGLVAFYGSLHKDITTHIFLSLFLGLDDSGVADVAMYYKKPEGDIKLMARKLSYRLVKLMNSMTYQYVESMATRKQLSVSEEIPSPWILSYRTLYDEALKMDSPQMLLALSRNEKVFDKPLWGLSEETYNAEKALQRFSRRFRSDLTHHIFLSLFLRLDHASEADIARAHQVRESVVIAYAQKMRRQLKDLVLSRITHTDHDGSRDLRDALGGTEKWGRWKLIKGKLLSLEKQWQESWRHPKRKARVLSHFHVRAGEAERFASIISQRMDDIPRDYAGDAERMVIYSQLLRFSQGGVSLVKSQGDGMAGGAGGSLGRHQDHLWQRLHRAGEYRLWRWVRGLRRDFGSLADAHRISRELLWDLREGEHVFWQNSLPEEDMAWGRIRGFIESHHLNSRQQTLFLAFLGLPYIHSDDLAPLLDLTPQRAREITSELAELWLAVHPWNGVLPVDLDELKDSWLKLTLSPKQLTALRVSGVGDTLSDELFYRNSNEFLTGELRGQYDDQFVFLSLALGMQPLSPELLILLSIGPHNEGGDEDPLELGWLHTSDAVPRLRDRYRQLSEQFMKKVLVEVSP